MYFLYAFLIVLVKKTYTFYMLKWHISLLYIGCIKIFTNRFVGNFCPDYLTSFAKDLERMGHPTKKPHGPLPVHKHFSDIP